MSNIASIIRPEMYIGYGDGILGAFITGAMIAGAFIIPITAVAATVWVVSPFIYWAFALETGTHWPEETLYQHPSN